MQLVAALDQVERHRLAHDAEPDETDLHGGNLPLGCAVDWVDSTRSAWPRQAFPADPGQAGTEYESASPSAVGRRGSFPSPITSSRRHIPAYHPSFASNTACDPRTPTPHSLPTQTISAATKLHSRCRT